MYYLYDEWVADGKTLVHKSVLPKGFLPPKVKKMMDLGALGEFDKNGSVIGLDVPEIKGILGMIHGTTVYQDTKVRFDSDGDLLAIIVSDVDYVFIDAGLLSYFKNDWYGKPNSSGPLADKDGKVIIMPFSKGDKGNPENKISLSWLQAMAEAK